MRPAFQRIHRARDRLVGNERELAALLEKTGGDLGGEKVNAMTRAMIAIHQGLSHIGSYGIQIKDLDRGLVDFPDIRNGREVFLCWELEDDDIEFWHDAKGFGDSDCQVSIKTSTDNQRIINNYANIDANLRKDAIR